MLIEPNYGFEEDMKNKKFRLVFSGCNYLSEFKKVIRQDIEISFPDEFDYWGIDFDEETSLGKKLESLRKKLSEKYPDHVMYYFGGFGNIDIVLMCSESQAIEIE